MEGLWAQEGLYVCCLAGGTDESCPGCVEGRRVGGIYGLGLVERYWHRRTPFVLLRSRQGLEWKGGKGGARRRRT